MVVLSPPVIGEEDLPEVGATDTTRGTNVMGIPSLLQWVSLSTSVVLAPAMLRDVKKIGCRTRAMGMSPSLLFAISTSRSGSSKLYSRETVGR